MKSPMVTDPAKEYLEMFVRVVIKLFKGWFSILTGPGNGDCTNILNDNDSNVDNFDDQIWNNQETTNGFFEMFGMKLC